MKHTDTTTVFRKKRLQPSIEYSKEMNEAMTQFGLSSVELEKLMTQQYAHLIVEVEDENRLRLITSECAFSIDTHRLECSAHVPDTFWLHALYKVKSARETETKRRVAAEMNVQRLGRLLKQAKKRADKKAKEVAALKFQCLKLSLQLSKAKKIAKTA